MEPARAAELASAVAAALAAAHAQGIVHRDVKPANVLIAADTGTVKVADFGIARAANVRQGLTMPGTVLGTASYLSPEQAQGAEVDHRSDIYSLGMVLWEMLTGKAPFTGDSPVAIAYQQLSETAPPPSTHNPRISPALDAVVMKAMSKDPAARQASADELRAELLDIDRAAGDTDATAAVVSPVTAVGDSTTVLAGSSTSVLPPVAQERYVERGPVGPVPADVYRRRRAAVIAALALVALVVIAILVLSSGDDDRGTVAVPSVVGLSVADATRALDDAGLKAQVTERDSPVAANQVADQDPDAGVIISRGATVTLFVPRAAPTTTDRPATTRAPVTTVPATTTTQAPTTTAPPTTAPTTTRPAPPTTIVVPTTSVFTTTTRL